MYQEALAAVAPGQPAHHAYEKLLLAAWADLGESGQQPYLDAATAAARGAGPRQERYQG